MKKSHRPSILRSQKGNVILWSLATAVAGIASALILTPMFQSAQRQVSIQNSKSAFESLLQGSLDYTLAGVKNRWCFTSSMLQDPTCNLLHDGNIERVMMSLDTVQFVKSFMRENIDYQGNVILQRIFRLVPLTHISDGHPLFTLVQSLPSGNVTGINFEINRIVDVDESPKSREVLLSVRISFAGSDEIAGMFAEAKVAVFPRELNTFSLLLPNDLYLGSEAPINNYDSSIIGDSGASRGLLFLSPVFVNGNIVIPRQDIVAGYTGVTFAERVFTAGSLFEGLSAFSSRSAGSTNDQLLSNLKNFGGFLNGLELESSRDVGLDYLAQINLPVQPPRELFEFCKERTLARLELNYTNMTRTLVRPVPTINNSIEFTTGGINDLFPQRGLLRTSYHLTGPMQSGIDLGPGSYGNDPIVRLSMELSGFNGIAVPNAVQADLAFQDTVWLQVPGGLKVGLRVDPVVVDVEGDHEPNKFRLTTLVQNANATNLGPIRIGSPPSVAYLAGPNLSVSVQPFDLGFNFGVNQRPNSVPTLDRNKVNGAVFTLSSGTNFVATAGNDPVETWYGCPDMDGTRAECMDSLVTTTDPVEARKLIPLEGISYAALSRACGNLRDFGGAPGQYPAFGGADWSTSFANQADRVWGFTEFDSDPATPDTGYYDGTYILSSTNAGNAVANNMFHVKARARRCLIEASATTVAGFFVCDTFEIGPRALPLKIIGSVIATKLLVDPSAITAGVQWSSIYHPLAVEELRRLRILQSIDAAGNPATCESDPAEPAWLPNISMNKSYQYYRCSASFLRDKADPFKWTSVDPDCGLPPPPAAQYKCKGRTTKFMIKEISRRSRQ